jgi:hypothetical protein
MVRVIEEDPRPEGLPGSREIQARGRRSVRGSLSKIAKPTATRCSLPSMVTATFMTYRIRPSIRASRGGHEGSRVYEAYNGPVAGLVGIEVGVVSGVTNLKSPGVGAPGRRPRHEECYQQA